MGKTDNKSLTLKIALRRRIIREAKLTELSVLDLYAGEGVIWQELRKAGLKIKTYLPVDQAPRMPGTLKVRVTEPFLQALDLKKFNVVDVDTYGEPWLAWQALFPRIEHRTVIFLTHGRSNLGSLGISKFARSQMGIPASWPLMPSKELARFADRYILLRHVATARIVKGYRVPLPNVTYYGLICQPAQLRLSLEGKE